MKAHVAQDRSVSNQTPNWSEPQFSTRLVDRHLAAHDALLYLFHGVRKSIEPYESDLDEARVHANFYRAVLVVKDESHLPFEPHQGIVELLNGRGLRHSQ